MPKVKMVWLMMSVLYGVLLIMAAVLGISVGEFYSHK